MEKICNYIRSFEPNKEVITYENNSQQMKLHMINCDISVKTYFFPAIFKNMDGSTEFTVSNYLSIHIMQRIEFPSTSKSKALLISSKLISCVIKPSKLSS